jgi:hypothetical protein
VSCCPSLALSWIVLVYEKGIVKADVPFRKTKSKHNVVTVEFYGNELEGVRFSDLTSSVTMMWKIKQLYKNIFPFHS